MRLVAFDTETALIRPGHLAPELTCISYMTAINGVCYENPALLHQGDPHAYEIVRDWLLDGQTEITGFNTAFDMAVLARQWPDLLPLIFRKYDLNQITDVMIRQQLLDIAGGCFRGQAANDGRWIQHNYNLDAVTHRLLGYGLDKDTWRLQYGSLRDVALVDWPEGARTYPLEDARATLGCHLAQAPHREYIPSEFHEARAAFWQHLMSAWGLRTSPEGVRQLKEATLEELALCRDYLIAEGLVRRDGTRDTKAAQRLMIEVMHGRPMTVTPTGQPKLDTQSCKDSENAVLELYARYTTLNKVLGNDVEMLEQGLVQPIHPRYGIAESGRATCSGPNIQNLRRLPGVREAFIPRPGNVFIDCDYPQLELWALGYVQRWLFGHSELADVLTTGRDPHTALAADILGITYEEGVKRNKDKEDKEFQAARSSQGAKGANFGFPGGLGPKKFVAFSKAGGIAITEERATFLREKWFDRWPEMRLYFQHIQELCEAGGPDQLATVVLPSTGMIRGGARFCAAANTYFQGLGAAATKVAGWMLAKECYVDRSSVLYSSRPVAVIHDQFIVETPENGTMHEAAFRVAQIMEEGAETVMPGCAPHPVEPVLCRFWSKNAKTIFGADGRLAVWPQETKS